MLEMINSYLETACNDFDMDLFRVDSYLEAVDRQLAIHRAEAELKVMRESGTEADLAYLYEAAEEGVVESIRKGIDKIIEAIKKFFSELKDKIIDMLDKARNDKALDAVEKKVKLLPLLGKKKVEVEDYDKQEKAFDKAMSGFKKLIAKVKSGQNVKEEDVEEVESTFMEEHGKAIGIAAAITITVSALVVLCKNSMSKVGDKIKTMSKETTSTAESAQAAADKSADAARILKNITASIANVSRTAARSAVQYVSNLINTLKNAVSGAKNTAVSADMSKKVVDTLKGVKEAAEEELAKAAADAQKTITSAENSSKEAASTTTEEPANEDATNEEAKNESSVWDDLLGDDVDAVSATDTVPVAPEAEPAEEPVTVPQTDVPDDVNPVPTEDECGPECGPECGDKEACSKECGEAPIEAAPGEEAANEEAEEHTEENAEEANEQSALEAAIDKIFTNPQPITFEEATKASKPAVKSETVEPTGKAVDETGLGDKKENNEKLISDLFNKIRDEVNGKDTTVEHKPVKKNSYSEQA